MPINYIENYNLILKELNKIRLSEALYIDGNEVKFDYIKFYIAKLALNKKDNNWPAFIKNWIRGI